MQIRQRGRNPPTRLQHVFRTHAACCQPTVLVSALCHVLSAKPTSGMSDLQPVSQTAAARVRAIQPPSTRLHQEQSCSPPSYTQLFNSSPLRSFAQCIRMRKVCAHRTRPQTETQWPCASPVHLEDRYLSLLDERVHLFGVGCVRVTLTLSQK